MGTRRTFSHEIIHKSTSLIPTFGSLHAVGLPKALVPIYTVVQMHWPWECKDWSLIPALLCSTFFINFFKFDCANIN